MTANSLEFQYERNSSVWEVKTRIRDCVESISIGFDKYGESHTRGPGLYLAIVSARSVTQFAEPMGSNTWPTDTCSSVGQSIDAFYDAASTVAYSRDGGVCIGVDGTILEQMVRFKNVRDDELPDGVRASELEYADWMGARHMSAYETSLRSQVLTTVTLSEETGRITIFRDGEYEMTPREQIGEPWRGQESV